MSLNKNVLVIVCQPLIYLVAFHMLYLNRWQWRGKGGWYSLKI